MSVWVEIHCDDAHLMEVGCSIMDANYPSALAATPKIGYDLARGYAIALGWKFRGSAAYCPGCVRRRKIR